MSTIYTPVGVSLDAVEETEQQDAGEAIDDNEEMGSAADADQSVASFDSADFSSQSSASSGKINELINSTTQEVEAGINEFDAIMNDEGGHNKRGRGEPTATVKKKRKGKKKKTSKSKK